VCYNLHGATTKPELTIGEGVMSLVVLGGAVGVGGVVVEAGDEGCGLMGGAECG
jgi:hypothetical protein